MLVSLPRLLAVLMLLALAVRVEDLTQPIVRFHPTRHYRSAMLARACYVDHASAVPPELKAVAQANREMQPAGELPVMEWLACGAYLAIGREEIAIPRALAALFWVGGAWPVWLLASRFGSPHGALIAAMLHLFLPYGIVASRNFQPDPLMTFASLWAIVALVRHCDQRRKGGLKSAAGRNAMAAAIAVGLAGVIKPMSVFLTVPALVALWLSRRDMWMLAGGLVPPAIYYGYSAIAGTLVQDQMRLRFAPHLLTTELFWKGLATQAHRVETLPLLLLAVSGALSARDALARRLLLALFLGYAAFAVAFTYHMPTHDYYHLPYIAVVAVGIGVLIDRLEVMAPRRVAAAVTLALCASIVTVGTASAWPQLRVDKATAYVRLYAEIGELAQHSTKVLFLDAEYGYPLMYHAQISGDAWPNQDDLAAEALDRRARLDAHARFARDFEDWGPRYFVVTDMQSFGRSPDLQQLLEQRATLVGSGERYRVYRFD